MMNMTTSRHRAMRNQAVHARDILAAGRLPEPVKEKLAVDLRNAIRRGFHVDLDQLELALVPHQGASVTRT